MQYLSIVLEKLESRKTSEHAKTCKAVQGYEFCNRLFELERTIETLPAEERLRQRRAKSGSIVEAHWSWLAGPTGKLEDAVTYAQN